MPASALAVRAPATPAAATLVPGTRAARPRQQARRAAGPQLGAGPRCEPAYEDSAWQPSPAPMLAPAGTRGDQGALPLVFALSVPPSPQPWATTAGGLRLVQPAPDEDDDAGPRPTPTSELPDPAGWAGRYVQATLEVLAGHRPVTQLVRWTSAGVYADVQRHALRTRRQNGPARQALVRSVRVSMPVDGVAEVSAVVLRSGRVRAVALRLEGLGGRWQCTALQVG